MPKEVIVFPLFHGGIFCSSSPQSKTEQVPGGVPTVGAKYCCIYFNMCEAGSLR